jgi:inositol 1,4,5-triphosphate receptor type 1/inositol 1,4,5-triphosphate receptor type 3
MYTINRETQREKILGLMVAKRAIFHEIEYNYKLHQSTIPVTHRTITVIRTLGSTVSVLINVLMVLFYSVVVKNKTATFHAEFYEEY